MGKYKGKGPRSSIWGTRTHHNILIKPRVKRLLEEKYYVEFCLPSLSMSRWPQDNHSRLGARFLRHHRKKGKKHQDSNHVACAENLWEAHHGLITKWKLSFFAALKLPHIFEPHNTRAIGAIHRLISRFYSEFPQQDLDSNQSHHLLTNH